VTSQNINALDQWFPKCAPWIQRDSPPVLMGSVYTLV